MLFKSLSVKNTDVYCFFGSSLNNSNNDPYCYELSDNIVLNSVFSKNELIFYPLIISRTFLMCFNCLLDRFNTVASSFSLNLKLLKNKNYLDVSNSLKKLYEK